MEGARIYSCLFGRVHHRRWLWSLPFSLLPLLLCQDTLQVSLPHLYRRYFHCNALSVALSYTFIISCWSASVWCRDYAGLGGCQRIVG